MTDNAGAGTAVAAREPAKQNAVATLLTSAKAREYIEPFLPKGTDIQRVAASLMLAIRKDESGKLRLCTAESLIMGMAKIVQWGAELGTGAYLLPFKSGNLTAAAQKRDPKADDVYEATPVKSYGFLAEMAAACGYPLEVKVVRQGDSFEYSYGLNAVLVHRPIAKNPGPVTHAWVIVHPPRNRQPFFEVMTIEDIDAIRKLHSKQWKSGPCPPWYAKKTVIRQVTKTLPKTPELARLHATVESEAHEEAELLGVVEPQQQIASGTETDITDDWEEYTGNDA